LRHSPSRLARRELLTHLGRARAETGGHWIRVHRPAMACRFEVTLASEDARFVPAARVALDEVEAIESRITVFRDSSELCRMNREAALGPAPVSADLMGLLCRCQALHAATGGAFDPTSTPLSREWGFLARQGRQPSPEAIEASQARVGMERVVLDPERLTVAFTVPGAELNMGSIGKGWALDRVGVGLRAVGVGRALVSAGGSSFLGWGREAWHVALSPGGRRLGDLWLKDAALGSSGVGEQHFVAGGRRLGHVIDPRTGRPADGVRSATVVTDDATDADALATALLVAGPRLARTWCAERPDTVAILLLEDDPGTLLQFGQSERLRIEPSPGIDVETDGP
jgi:thiamine biosynthesis lipoprotein